MDIDKMPAGREMDALVAEKVMGHAICEHSRTKSTAQSSGIAMCGVRECKGELHYEYLPRYSTDIAAAWEVVEKLQRDDFTVVVSANHSSNYQACMIFKGFAASYGPADAFLYLGKTEEMSVAFGEKPPVRVAEETVPLSICRAALKVISQI